MNELPLHTKVQIKLKTGFFGLKKEQYGISAYETTDNSSSALLGFKQYYKVFILKMAL